MSDLYWLTDEQMVRLRPHFPKSHGRPRVDDQRVLSGIIFVNRNGLRWRDAPAAYGPYKTLCNRWKRLSEAGVFIRMMEGLSAAGAVFSLGHVSSLQTGGERCDRARRGQGILLGNMVTGVCDDRETDVADAEGPQALLDLRQA